MTFLAYLAEAVAVHLIDLFIGGLAGWLIGRGGKGRGFGIVILIIYGMAVGGPSWVAARRTTSARRLRLSPFR